MNFKWMKTLTKVFNKSKNEIVKHAPQILAAAGAGCFIAATYCAVKETPEAMEKLEEKKALDPDMTTLQKAAVVVPHYKKTLAFTAGGVGLTIGAWKIEATIFAEMAGIAATAIDKNRKLEEAAKKVVGEEKATEIVEKVEKDECPFDEDPDAWIPDECRVVPCKLRLTGKTFWNSRRGLDDGMEQCVQDLKDKGILSAEEWYGNLKAGQCDLDLCWAVSRSDGFGYAEEDARTELRYHITPWEDEYHRLGWQIEMYNSPQNL